MFLAKRSHRNRGGATVLMILLLQLYFYCVCLNDASGSPNGWPLGNCPLYSCSSYCTVLRGLLTSPCASSRLDLTRLLALPSCLSNFDAALPHGNNSSTPCTTTTLAESNLAQCVLTRALQLPNFFKPKSQGLKIENRQKKITNFFLPKIYLSFLGFEKKFHGAKGIYHDLFTF